MNYDSPEHTRALLAYSAWKTLILAHGFITAARVRASVFDALQTVERELRNSYDLLPPRVQDELNAHFKRQVRDPRKCYEN